MTRGVGGGNQASNTWPDVSPLRRVFEATKRPFIYSSPTHHRVFRHILRHPKSSFLACDDFLAATSSPLDLRITIFRTDRMNFA